MTKPEELALKEQKDFTEDDWNYLMSMDFVEIKQYYKAKSRDRGLVKFFRSQEDANKD